MGSDVRGNDEQGLRQALARQLAVVCKVSANTPPPTQTLGGGGGAPAPAEAKLNVKAETNSGESESESAEEDGADFVAALEEAVGELGLSTEHVKKMPGDTANSPLSLEGNCKDSKYKYILGYRSVGEDDGEERSDATSVETEFR